MLSCIAITVLLSTTGFAVAIADANIIGYCNQPDTPKHGNRTYSVSWIVGSEVRYWCNFGYTLHGPTNAVCIEDHQETRWSDPAPSCIGTSCECGSGGALARVIRITSGLLIIACMPHASLLINYYVSRKGTVPVYFSNDQNNLRLSIFTFGICCSALSPGRAYHPVSMIYNIIVSRENQLPSLRGMISQKRRIQSACVYVYIISSVNHSHTQ